jgi:protein subunit release factor A
MKTDRLEEFIKNNREAFDDKMPSPKVWENIEKATTPTKKVWLNPVWLRVAAVVAVVIITAVLATQTGILRQNEYASKTNDPEMRELIEAEAFYAQQVNGKLKEIRKCYNTNPELKEEIETDLTELEDMYNDLKKDLKDNISNKMVIEAMIVNNRNRLKLVDDVLEQIKC